VRRLSRIERVERRLRELGASRAGVVENIDIDQQVWRLKRRYPDTAAAVVCDLKAVVGEAAAFGPKPSASTVRSWLVSTIKKRSRNASAKSPQDDFRDSEKSSQSRKMEP
jgi:hypothetical protein